LGWGAAVRRFGRLLGWFVAVDALITIFGAATGPLLLAFAADGLIGLLIIRSYMEKRAAMDLATAIRKPLAVRLLNATAAAQQHYRHGDH
jgi:hypothetical protein